MLHRRLMLSMPALLLAKRGQAQPSGRIRIGQAADTISFLPLAAARALDGFAAAGLALEHSVQNGDQACLAALAAGEIDAAAVGSPALLAAIGKGQPFRMVAVLMNKVSLELVLGNKAMERSGVSPADDPLDKRLAALKGMVLGISAVGGAQEHAARFLARQAGLDGAEVRLVEAGPPPAMQQALAAERIDGLLLSPPAGLQAEDARVGQVLVRLGEEFPALKVLPFLVLAVRTPMDPAARPRVVAACKVLRGACTRLLADPHGVAATMQATLFSGMKVPAVQAAVRSLSSGIAGHGRIDPASVAPMLAFAGSAAAGPDTKPAFWTNEYWDEAGH